MIENKVKKKKERMGTYVSVKTLFLYRPVHMSMIISNVTFCKQF